jgi:hypothetical protein
LNALENLSLYKRIQIEDIEKGTVRETTVSKRRKLYKGEFQHLEDSSVKLMDHVASVREMRRR